MKKLEKESLDLVKDNIKKLKEIFPDVFTEDKIDFEKLRENLGEFVEESDEKYQFTWFGKKKANQLALTPTKATLRPDKESSKNWDSTKNIYIEGDNLEVLKVLQKAYYKKIKMIYIDPPYNTGKDFIYKDSYQDNLKNYLAMTGQIDEEGNSLTTNIEKSGRKHSNWLNMMYPRLKLARNLLRDDGVIFVSIDDNEVANLRKIMDEIFGEENLLLIQVINRPSEIASNYTISKHEYILIYAKNIDFLNLNFLEKYTISRGTVGNINQTMPIIEFPAGLRCIGIEDGIYKETRKKKNSLENIENLNTIVVENGLLKYSIKLKARWRSSNDMRNFFNNNCKLTKAKISGYIEEIYFKDNTFNPQIKKLTYEKIPSLFLKNKMGSKDLKKLHMEKFFEHPKSVNLFKEFLKLTFETDLILDFFSGSATTAHAVMELNAED
jgi:adenine-specific DNA-methyltransferase